MNTPRASLGRKLERVSTRACRYQAKVTLTQAGQHTVAVLLDGEHVDGSPYAVVATAAALWLPACRLVGSGLQRARAGETTVFSLQAADRSGNAIQTGGANLTVQFKDPIEIPNAV
jgi:filamin